MRIKKSNIPVSLDAMLPENKALLKREIAAAFDVGSEEISEFKILRKSVDARKKSDVHFVLTCEVELGSNSLSGNDNREIASSHEPARDTKRRAVDKEIDGYENALAAANFEGVGTQPIVVGAGPAGLFCALELARAGLKPLLIERGSSVEERQRKVQDFAHGGELDANTNVQFGEGGAGTFSDGKLNTGKHDPRIRQVLGEFAAAGAPESILVDAKPHIGTDYLPKVVCNLREAIIQAGGEVLFDTQLVSITPGTPVEAVIRNLKTNKDKTLKTYALVLAIGHSARDTIQMLHDVGAEMQRKPFAVGVRIEHDQDAINKAQYGAAANHPALGAADYKLNVRTSEGRGVYTFCMCPGGEVVAAASEEGGVCVNGMSNYARNGANANSALLVEVLPEDFEGDDVLAGIQFQRDLEHAAYELGASGLDSVPYMAPAQTVGSFLNKTKPEPSKRIKPTYSRGVAWRNLHECLPALIAKPLAEAIPALDKKLHGFADPEAILTAVEARSSSPVRIVRNRETLESTAFENIYPAGEGAGYAGGITSAAVDGIRVAEAIISKAAEKQAIQQAAAELQAGNPIVFPTDTVCGLGVSVKHAPNTHALAEIKGRPENKPIAWLVSSSEALKEFGKNVPDYAFELAENHWPGALTLIVEASENVPEAFRSEANTIGLRMPDSPLALKLIKATHSPIATTSANLTNQPATSCLSAVHQSILDKAYSLPNISACSASKTTSTEDILPSTVIDCTGQAPRVLRKGAIVA